MRINILDLLRCDPGHCQCDFNSLNHIKAFALKSCHMIGIERASIAVDFPIDERCATLSGVLQRLQDKKSAAFSKYKTIPAIIKRPGSPLWSIIAWSCSLNSIKGS